MWKTKAAAPHRAAAFLVVLDDLECPPRCSGHIQRKNYFKFRVSEKSADFPETLFHKWGCNWQRQMPRYPFRLAASRQATFPKGTAELPQSKPDGFASSLGEGASGAPGSFALQPETLPPCQRPHPRGGCLRSRLGEFRQIPPQSRLTPCQLPQGDAFALYRKPYRHHQQPSPWGRWLRPTGADGRGDFHFPTLKS